MAHKKSTVQINFDVPQEIKDKLRAQAAAERRTVKQVLLDALNNYFTFLPTKKKKPAKPPKKPIEAT